MTIEATAASNAPRPFGLLRTVSAEAWLTFVAGLRRPFAVRRAR